VSLTAAVQGRSEVRVEHARVGVVDVRGAAQPAQARGRVVAARGGGPRVVVESRAQGGAGALGGRLADEPVAQGEADPLQPGAVGEHLAAKL
jgi:hypothetical protein